METGSRKFEPTPIGVTLSELATQATTATSPIGLPIGFPKIDEYFGFLQNGELTTLGARPGGGKTTFAIQLSRFNAAAGKRVLYVSLEMSRREFVSRFACIELGIDSRDLRQGCCTQADRDNMVHLANEWRDKDFIIWDPPRATIHEIESRARFIHATGGLDLLVVDHLQIVKAESKQERYQHLGDVTQRLKAIAKELEIPVLLQSQLRRSEDRPQLSSLRESGDIEQNADNVWFLHRDAPATVEFIVAKFRHGEPGSVTLPWKHGQFWEE